jgi:DNA-binding IclR family transcriptional regulator
MSASSPNDHVQRISERPEPRFSRSLEYGAAMLECFSAERTVLRISELADMLELSRSTAHRYAISLVQLGYLEQDDRRRYRLTHNAALSGMSLVNRVRLATPARAALEELRKKTSATVSMGMLDETRVIYIHRLYSHRAGQYQADLELGVGAHVPVYCTAIGKALLASLSEGEQTDILAKLTLVRHAPNTIKSKRKLAEELAAVRLDGFSTCDEEQAPNVRSIAKTIHDPGASQAMAISVTAPAGAYTVDRLVAEFGPHLAKAATRIGVPAGEAR